MKIILGWQQANEKELQAQDQALNNSRPGGVNLPKWASFVFFFFKEKKGLMFVCRISLLLSDLRIEIEKFQVKAKAGYS